MHNPVAVQFSGHRAGKRAQRLPGVLFLCATLGAAHADDALRERSSPAADITVLALTGQPAPDGRGIIAGLRTTTPLLNSQRQVQFVADIHSPEVHIDAHALLRSGRVVFYARISSDVGEREGIFLAGAPAGLSIAGPQLYPHAFQPREPRP